MDKQKKVMLVSYNALSKEGANGRTLEFLLSGFQKENLSQIFFSEEKPDFSFASNYYKVTEENLLKAIIKRTSVGGVVKEAAPEASCGAVSATSDRKNSSFFSKISKFAKAYKKTNIMKFFRGALWRLGKKHWYSKNLKEWLDNIAPDVIVTISGKNSCFHKIALDLAKERKIPLVVYHCEDYCFKQEKKDFFYKKYISGLKKSVDEIMNYASLAIYNSESTRALYSKEYSTPSMVVYMAADTQTWDEKELNKDNLVLSYMGNLALQRYVSICQVAKAMEKVSPNAVINVYSPNLPENSEEMFAEHRNISYKGFVSYEECKMVIKESDILLHVESFDEKNIKNLKVAFSTKIADSLASGRLFFVYAPRGIASTEYLIQNECACVVSDKNDLESSLLEIIENDELRKKTIAASLTIAKEKHSKEKSNKEIYIAIHNICK